MVDQQRLYDRVVALRRVVCRRPAFCIAQADSGLVFEQERHVGGAAKVSGEVLLCTPP